MPTSITQRDEKRTKNQKEGKRVEVLPSKGKTKEGLVVSETPKQERSKEMCFQNNCPKVTK